MKSHARHLTDTDDQAQVCPSCAEAKSSISASSVVPTHCVHRKGKR